MTTLVSSELLKLRTTRAPFWLLVTQLVFSGLVAAAAIGAGELGDDRALGLMDAAELSSIFAMLAGVLLVTNEYRHGTITPTFLVTPPRERVVSAKLLAGGVAGLIAGFGVALVALAIALPWLSARDEPLDVNGALAYAVFALVGTFVLSAVLGVAVGTLIHSQLGAVIAVFAWFLAIEPILFGVEALLGAYTRLEGDEITPYMPGSVFDALVSQGADDLLAPRWALLLVLLYTAVVAALGLLITLRRDAE